MRHKVNIKISLMLALMLLGTFGAKVSAQSGAVSTVKGVVTDGFGRPLQGVIVNTENGRNGSSTDIDGAYIVTVMDGSKALVFSFPGYKDAKEAIDGKEEIDLVMQFDAHRKDEVIEMGWTSQKRGDISGAVSQIKGKTLESIPTSTLSPALVGQLPGLTSTVSNNQLGATSSFLDTPSVFSYIRGVSNYKNSMLEPLVVIDGVPTTYKVAESFDLITAREIESITLLKDASTQALYGVKGNQGVLVVTTKRGVKGRVNIDVSYNQSIQQPIKTQKWYGSAEYATFKNEAAYNDNPAKGKTQIYSAEDISRYISGADPKLYPNNNWYDMFYKDLSTMSRASVNISGGSDKFTYYTNVNFMHQGGQFNTTNERYKNSYNDNWFNYRTNVDVVINKYLSAYLRLSGNIQRQRMPGTMGGDVYNYFYQSMYYWPANMYGPLTPAEYADDGTLLNAGGGAIVDDKWGESLYALLNRSGNQKQTTVNIASQFGLKLDMSFLTKGLSLNGYMAYQTHSYGVLYTSQSEYMKFKKTDDPTQLTFVRSGTSKDAPITYSKNSRAYYHLDYRVSMDYQRTFGKHSVTAMGYMYYQNMIKDKFFASAVYILPYNTVLSGFQASYGYDNRYLVKFDLGYSGTEQFKKEHRFVSTPSVSGAWVVSNEPFMKGAQKWLTDLKLRASYGRTATDVLGLEGATRFPYADDIQFGNGGLIPSLQYITWEGSKGNPLLHPSTMLKQNYGIDIGLFNGFSFSFDYFKERSNDVLISATSKIPSYQGIPLGYYPGVQEGIYENNGYELTANYIKQFNKDWTFNVGGFVGFNQNKVIYVDESPKGDTYAYRNRTEGFQINQNWGLVWDKGANGNGFYNTQDQIDDSDLTYGGSLPKPKLGDLVFKDMNGDYVIDEKDEAPLGFPSLPQITYAFNAGFTWKSLEFNIMFQGVGRCNTMESSGWLFGNQYSGIYNRMHEKAWSPERYAAGSEIEWPALSGGTTASQKMNSSFFLVDRSYIRLKNVEIAYTLPLKVSRKIASEKIRFSLSGQNLVTWDNMKSADYGPDDYFLSVPAYRVYNVGVSLLF